MLENPSASPNVPRLESWAKAAGGRYTGDMGGDGVVYGAILHCPYPRAEVVALDVAPALALPGVLAALTPDEVADIRYNSSGNPPSELLIRDESILTQRPLFEGDRVAAVAAISPDLCRRALEQIRVEYHPLPAAITLDEALRPDAPLLHPGPEQSNLFTTLAFDQGDLDEAFARCDVVEEDVFSTPAVHPLPLEPTGCICDWGPEGITIHSTSQTPFQERRLLAEMFGLPESAVRVVKPMMGGGFGARQQLHHQPVGCLLSRKCGRPVKMIHTRTEEMLATVVRHGARIRARAGADAAGNLLALDLEVWHDTGAYCTHGPVILSAQGKKTPYRLDGYRYRGHCVYTNNQPAGAMRGYGNPQVTFARELLLDRIARRLNMDPVELRLRNCLAEGERVPGTATVVTSTQAAACFAEARRLRDTADRDYDRPGQWGTALCLHTSGPSNKSGMSAAELSVNPDGSVQLRTGACDIGQGCETAHAQLVAEALGIPLGCVGVRAADTAATPYDTGTFASSQMFVGGNAVLRAAGAVIASLREALAEQCGCAADAVTFAAGVFATPAGRFPFREAAGRVLYGSPGRVVTGHGSYRAKEAPPVFAVCMVRAERDPLTGSIAVTDVVETVDAGAVINPNIVRGQIEGGVVQGLGYGWMEQMQADRRSGKCLTGDLLLYRIPTAADCPRIHGAAVPGFDPLGPLGAKSVGELTLVPVAAALAVCVERLLERPVRALPLGMSHHLHARREE